MRLIPDQVKMLKERYENCQREREELIAEKEGITSVIVDEGRTTDNDYAVIKQIADLSKEASEIQKILNKATIVEKVNKNWVDVGSTFKVYMNFGGGDTETIEATFIEKKVAGESSEYYISGESDFGKAIYHKKIGDIFAYPLMTGKTARGTILEFTNNKETPKTYVKKDK